MSSVSVFIPCYKYAHYLRGCVESCLRQEGVDVRVLILDDCSPDNTPEVARQLMAEDPRVEYHRNPTNRGHIETYNVGLEWAAGDYCLLLSADDMLTPGALARAARVMGEHPEVVLTYGGEVRTAQPEFDSVPVPGGFNWRVMSGGEFWRISGDMASNIVPTPTAVVRTATHKLVGGYRKDLPHSGDLEMWLRLAGHGSVGVIDVPQGFYRTHGQNMSTIYSGLRDLQQRRAAFDVAFETCGHRVADAPAIMAHARRYLAEEAFWLGHRLFENGERARSQECFDSALAMCPELRRWRSWRRLRVKQVLGPRIWGAYRRLVGLARGRRRAGPSLA
jgi:glycosyltransferase involved in cell wall biosynthesis